jgi:hypothetical protein
MKFDTNIVLCCYRIINIRSLQNCVVLLISYFSRMWIDITELFTLSYVVFWFMSVWSGKWVPTFPRNQLPLSIYPEGDGSTFFSKVGTHQPDCTAALPFRLTGMNEPVQPSLFPMERGHKERSAPTTNISLILWMLKIRILAMAQNFEFVSDNREIMKIILPDNMNQTMQPNSIIHFVTTANSLNR